MPRGQVHQMGRDVAAGTSMAEGAAHLTSRVVWERVIVTDHLTEGLMMVMLGAKVILCAAAIIARSLVPTSMPKTTAVMLLPQLLLKGLHWF